jgi:predicted nuclease with TOPRIM domain
LQKNNIFLSFSSPIICLYNQLANENSQLKQRVNQLESQVNEAEESLKALDAENRRNIAKIAKLENDNYRLQQAADRSVCGRVAARRSEAALKNVQ